MGKRNVSGSKPNDKSPGEKQRTISYENENLDFDFIKSQEEREARLSEDEKFLRDLTFDQQARYRCEQVNISKVNGNTVHFVEQKFQSLLKNNLEQKTGYIKLEEHLYNFSPPILNLSFEFISKTEFIPDPFVTDNRFTQNYNFDVGFLYRIEDFFLAFTASNILDKNIDNFNKIEPSKLRNFQAYAGNRFRQKNSNFELEPSLFYQYFQSDKRSTTDANIKVKLHDYEDYYWAGVTARF